MSKMRTYKTDVSRLEGRFPQKRACDHSLSQYLHADNEQTANVTFQTEFLVFFFSAIISLPILLKKKNFWKAQNVYTGK